MGLCVPVVCNAGYIQKQANQALALLNQTGFYTELVENPQEFYPKYGASFYVTSVFLGIIGLLVILATMYQKLSKKNAVIGAFDLRKNMHIF